MAVSKGDYAYVGEGMSTATVGVDPTAGVKEGEITGCIQRVANALAKAEDPDGIAAFAHITYTLGRARSYERLHNRAE